MKEYIIEQDGDASFFGQNVDSITLKDIRKKYVGKAINLDNLKGDVWNREKKNGEISFHFYFSNYDADRGAVGMFMDHVEMKCDENDVVTSIAPLYCERQESAGVRRSVFTNTRATSMHYDEFNKVIEEAFEKNN